MQLAQYEFGEKTDQPSLLIAHGLFGSARNWRAIAKRLSARRHVVTVDMRNHANSPRAETQSYEDMADDLAECIAQGLERVDVLGHSMGGKAAMMLSLRAPQAVDRLIVADIAPVPYRHTQSGYIDIMRETPLQGISRRSEADAHMASRIADPAMRAFLLQSLTIHETGASWTLNLDVLEAEMPKIIGFPEVSKSFTGNTLFLTGENSDYIRSSDHARILKYFPHGVFQAIPNAGHWVHAEAPKPFIEAVSHFLVRN